MQDIDGPACRHLHAAVRPAATLDVEARLARVRNDFWVGHEKAARVLSCLQEIFEQPRRGCMGNILLLGESGVGKTMLIDRFRLMHAVPPDEASGLEYQPVLAINMPPKPVTKLFAQRLLHRIFDLTGPMPNLLENRTLYDEVLHKLRQIRTKVLVIDEINSLLVGNPQHQRAFLQMLRHMSNELSIALVCVGVPEARDALVSDPQLRSRSTSVELPSWQADAELQRFTNLLLSCMPLRRPSPTDSPEMCQLLADRTGGVTRNIRRVLERAAIASIKSGRECVDLEALQDAALWWDAEPPAFLARP
jgi:hypothetical protein